MAGFPLTRECSFSLCMSQRKLGPSFLLFLIINWAPAFLRRLRRLWRTIRETHQSLGEGGSLVRTVLLCTNYMESTHKRCLTGY